MSQGTVLDNGDFECPTHGKSRWKGDVRCAVCERTHNLYDPHRTADKCACGAELWSHGGSARAECEQCAREHPTKRVPS